jgi:hypothetical protein
MMVFRKHIFKSFVIISVAALLITGIVFPFSDITKVYAMPDAQTIRVAPTGSDVSGCGSTNTPCKTIQYAVNKAASGDTIWVAAGSYSYQSVTDTCTFLVTRAVVCLVDKNLTILGGYTAGSWSGPDPVANPTIVDGGNSRRGVAIIVVHSTASLRMEGFIVQNSLAQGSTSSDDYLNSAFGGGMWAQNSSVTLRNMVFRNNRATGGNRSNKYGGAAGGGGLAIQSTKNGVVSILENVSFENNQAIGGSGSPRGGLAIGGGFYTYEATIQGSGIQFMNNVAQAGSSSGNGVDSVQGLKADAMGGGAGFQLRSSVVLTNVEASGNQSIGGNAGTGTGAQAGGSFGAGLCAELSTLTLTSASITDNLAVGGKATNGGLAFGGGIMANTTYTTLDRVKLINNAAVSGGTRSSGSAGSASGGGAYISGFATSGYTAQITNNIFANNRVEMGSPGTSPGGGGAGLVLQAVTADVIHSTFAENYFVGDVKVGQAIAINGTYGTSGVPASANLDYVIIADHVNTATDLTSALYVAQGSSAALNKVLFSGNTNNTNLNGKPLLPGTITGMNTTFDVGSVQFVSPDSPNFDYHLSPNSPAVDAATGSNLSTDIDGQGRPYNTNPDIGADEFVSVTSSFDNHLYIPMVRR